MRQLRSALAGILLAAIGSCGPAEPEPPITTLTIEVTGQNFEWIVRYPGPDGKLGTPDDVLDKQNLHVPAGADTTIVLKSKDYVYSFALPHIRAREMAVPDLEFTLRFTPEKPGTFELLGDEMCGYAHPTLVGKIFVEPAPAFRDWLKKRR